MDTSKDGKEKVGCWCGHQQGKISFIVKPSSRRDRTNSSRGIYSLAWKQGFPITFDIEKFYGVLISYIVNTIIKPHLLKTGRRLVVGVDTNKEKLVL